MVSAALNSYIRTRFLDTFVEDSWAVSRDFIEITRINLRMAAFHCDVVVHVGAGARLTVSSRRGDYA